MSAPQYHPAEDLERLWTEFCYQVQTSPHWELRTIWGRVLQLGDDVSAFDLFPWLVDVQRLVRTVRHDIETTPAVPAGPILKQYNRVELVLCEWRLNRGAAEFEYLMTESVADALHTAAHILRHSAPVARVSPDEVRTLEAHIDALAERVAHEPDLSPEIRRVLLLCLERMRHAIARYRIAGAEAFVDAWKECAGELNFAGDEVLAEAKPGSRTGFNAIMGELRFLALRALSMASHANTVGDIAGNLSDAADSLMQLM